MHVVYCAVCRFNADTQLAFSKQIVAAVQGVTKQQSLLPSQCLEVSGSKLSVCAYKTHLDSAATSIFKNFPRNAHRIGKPSVHVQDKNNALHSERALRCCCPHVGRTEHIYRGCPRFYIVRFVIISCQTLKSRWRTAAVFGTAYWKTLMIWISLLSR